MPPQSSPFPPVAPTLDRPPSPSLTAAVEHAQRFMPRVWLRAATHDETLRVAGTALALDTLPLGVACAVVLFDDGTTAKIPVTDLEFFDRI